jgi:hypothetical protein
MSIKLKGLEQTGRDGNMWKALMGEKWYREILNEMSTGRRMRGSPSELKKRTVI